MMKLSYCLGGELRTFVSDLTSNELLNQVKVKNSYAYTWDPSNNTYTTSYFYTRFPTNSIIICNTDDYDKDKGFTCDSLVTMLFSDYLGYLHKIK